MSQQNAELIRNAASDLLSFCPRLMSWSHREWKSLRHPYTAEVIKEMSRSTGGGIQDNSVDSDASFHEEKWKKMDGKKRWKLLEDAYQIIMYSSDIVRQRNDIILDVNFCRCVNRWWKRLFITHGLLNRKAYYYVNTCIYNVLVAKPMATADANKRFEFSHLEIMDSIESDWSFDCHGEKGVSFERFYLSMFELADNWTDTTNVEDYISFITSLFEEIYKSDDFYVDINNTIRQFDKERKEAYFQKIRNYSTSFKKTAREFRSLGNQVKKITYNEKPQEEVEVMDEEILPNSFSSTSETCTKQKKEKYHRSLPLIKAKNKVQVAKYLLEEGVEQVEKVMTPRTNKQTKKKLEEDVINSAHQDIQAEPSTYLPISLNDKDEVIDSIGGDPNNENCVVKKKIEKADPPEERISVAEIQPKTPRMRICKKYKEYQASNTVIDKDLISLFQTLDHSSKNTSLILKRQNIAKVMIENGHTSNINSGFYSHREKKRVEKNTSTNPALLPYLTSRNPIEYNSINRFGIKSYPLPGTVLRANSDQ